MLIKVRDCEWMRPHVQLRAVTERGRGLTVRLPAEARSPDAPPRPPSGLGAVDTFLRRSALAAKGRTLPVRGWRGGRGSSWRNTAILNQDLSLLRAGSVRRASAGVKGPQKCSYSSLKMRWGPDREKLKSQTCEHERGALTSKKMRALHLAHNSAPLRLPPSQISNILFCLKVQFC